MSYSDAVAALEGVEGWLTDAQARRLWERAAEAPAGGRILEIGSFHGRSTIVLALAAPRAHVVAVDPHAGGDRGPQEIESDLDRGARDNDTFRRNLARAGVAERVEHVRLPSREAFGTVPGELDLLYVDGAHRYRPARADIANWGARVKPGGRLLVHDAFSSVGVTLAQFRLLAAGPSFAYCGRSGSLADYRRVDLDRRARTRNLGLHLLQLPWFARNLAVKALLVARLRPLARLLGADRWPY